MAHQNGTFRRTRLVQQEREIPHTINGITQMVTERYATAVPVPPRDWDRLVRGAVTGATALTVTGAIAWSTASIGDLLAEAVHPAIAYGAATVFDLGWVSCMALEWLSRYDRRRATLPRRAGYIALVIAMAAVCTHGILRVGHDSIAAGVAVGIIGALVSALAKGLWTMALHSFSVELDDRSQQWVEAQFSAAHARLATAAVQRELARVEGATADMYAAYELPAAEPTHGDYDTALAEARRIMPDATDDQLTAQLVAAGLVTSTPQDDHLHDHHGDREMTTVPAKRLAREVVTSVVTPDPATMTRPQLLAAARRLNREALKGRSGRPVTIGTLQLQLGLSRREATEVRRAIVGD
jgi:hypothetical protein